LESNCFKNNLKLKLNKRTIIFPKESSKSVKKQKSYCILKLKGWGGYFSLKKAVKKLPTLSWCKSPKKQLFFKRFEICASGGIVNRF